MADLDLLDKRLDLAKQRIDEIKQRLNENPYSDIGDRIESINKEFWNEWWRTYIFLPPITANKKCPHCGKDI